MNEKQERVLSYQRYSLLQVRLQAHLQVNPGVINQAHSGIQDVTLASAVRSLRPGVVLLINLLQALVGDMGVDLGSRDITMAQQHLHDP